MMNESSKVFDYLQSSLIQWKPKDDPLVPKNQGFNEDNVVFVEMGSLPSGATFDYIYLSPPISSGGGLTTGATKAQRTTQTFNIDIYCKRGGVTKQQKINTINAMYEIKEFIENLFSQQGFIFTSPIADLNYTGDGTVRQIISITRTFTKI